jgi:hypothetical protein
MGLAAGTDTRNRPILGDLTADDQVDDLATLGQRFHVQASQLATAGTRAGQRDHDGVFRMVDQLPGDTRMVLLSARFAATRLTLGARRWFLERRVGGRRLAGIATVLGQTRFQLLEPLLELRDLPRLLRYGRAQRGVLRPQASQLGL